MNQAEINRIKRFAKGGDLEKFWEAYKQNPKQLFSIQDRPPREFSGFEWDGLASVYQIVKPVKKIFVQVGTRGTLLDEYGFTTHCIHGGTIDRLEHERSFVEANYANYEIIWHSIQVVEVPSEQVL